MRILWLALVLTLLIAWSAAARTELPTFPDRTTYTAARAQLVAEGYTPLPNAGRNRGDCEDHPALCRKFPELAGCIENAGSDCSYLWKAPDGDFLVIWADSCCNQWVDPPELIAADKAKAILSPPTGDLPHLSRKLGYPEVRKRLLVLGYVPQPIVSGRPEFTCFHSYKAMCRRYPELKECGRFCDFVYRRRQDGRLVVVMTRSEGSFGFYDMYFPDPKELHSLIIRPSRHGR
ncbi:MAG: hypothetical protein JWP50_1579 [Phenylobacterium sp.]|nr:hypothetical protein [Phenylobacterium sp.]